MKSEIGIVLESRLAFAVAVLAFALFTTAVLETAAVVSSLRLALNLIVLGGIALALALFTIRIEWFDEVFRKSYLFGHLGGSVFSSDDLISMAIRRDYTREISRVTLRFANGSFQIHRFQTGYWDALNRLQERFPAQFSEAKVERF